MKISKRFMRMAMVAILLAAGLAGQNSYGSNYTETVDTLSSDESDGRSGNDIRFDGWTEQDWMDNDYIRELRRFLDDYNAGKFECEQLDGYKDKIGGKFILFSIDEALLGGATLQVVFIDNPDVMVTARVYSYVDGNVVTGYSVRTVWAEDCSYLELTTSDIQQAMKEMPLLKEW